MDVIGDLGSSAVDHGHLQMPLQLATGKPRLWRCDECGLSDSSVAGDTVVIDRSRILDRAKAIGKLIGTLIGGLAILVGLIIGLQALWDSFFGPSEQETLEEQRQIDALSNYNWYRIGTIKKDLGDCDDLSPDQEASIDEWVGVATSDLAEAKTVEDQQRIAGVVHVDTMKEKFPSCKWSAVDRGEFREDDLAVLEQVFDPSLLDA